MISLYYNNLYVMLQILAKVDKIHMLQILAKVDKIQSGSLRTSAENLWKCS